VVALPLAAQAQQVIGSARLRYRPQTRMTAAWFAKSAEDGFEQKNHETVWNTNNDGGLISIH
jgi:hypothetical protein